MAGPLSVPQDRAGAPPRGVLHTKVSFVGRRNGHSFAAIFYKPDACPSVDAACAQGGFHGAAR